MSIAVNVLEDGLMVASNAEKAATVTLFIRNSPMKVVIDGKDLSAGGFRFNATDGTISLTMPAGQHDLKILFR